MGISRREARVLIQCIRGQACPERSRMGCPRHDFLSTYQGWKYEPMAGTNSKSGRVLKRRRADDSVSKLFAHKHKNFSNNKKIQERPLFTERYFWLLACCVITGTHSGFWYAYSGNEGMGYSLI